MMDITTAAVLSIVPTAKAYDGTNLRQVDASPHHMTTALLPGDVVWAVRDAAGVGNHLCVVRISRETVAARGGVSRSYPVSAQYEGAVTLESGRLILTTATMERVDMATAELL